jgi:cysteine desulfurase
VSAAARDGATALILAVDEDGRLDLGALEEALRSRPCVVSVMWGNNEVGVLQPVEEVAARCREAGVVMHTDAVQALGRVPVRVDRVPCDLLSVNAHKIGGPKGIGALYIRSGVELEPLLHGGGQENGLRPGTQNVAAAVGMAVAAELAVKEQAAEAERLARLRDRLERAIVEALPGTVVNGGGAPRLPHILNVSVPGVDQETVLVALDLEGVAASSGSACTSGAVELSHVLAAMGRSAAERAASVRFSLGRTTTEAEIDEAARRVVAVLSRMRAAA